MNYFITSIYWEKRFPLPDKHSSRTFGYYSTLEKAMKAVEGNLCNMQECLYNFLVIEEFVEGVHPICDTTYWYEWKWQRWEQISNQPEQFNGIINWALG